MIPSSEVHAQALVPTEQSKFPPKEKGDPIYKLWSLSLENKLSQPLYEKKRDKWLARLNKVVRAAGQEKARQAKNSFGRQVHDFTNLLANGGRWQERLQIFHKDAKHYWVFSKRGNGVIILSGGLLCESEAI